MDNASKINRSRKGPGHALFEFFASPKLATVLLILLFVLTWLATLEQTVTGLRPMMLKYFDSSWSGLFFFPEIGRPFSEGTPEPITIPFPFPSGFWLCVLFTINLALGGLVRMRKDWKRFGILLTHFSVVFMMIAALVTHKTEKRGRMLIWEGETSDTARDYENNSIEIFEMEGEEPSKVHMIDADLLSDLESGDGRLFRMKNLPFDLEILRWLENSEPMPTAMRKPTEGALEVDGFWLREMDTAKQVELNMQACEVAVKSKDGEVLEKILLTVPSAYFEMTRTEQPATFRYQDQTYLLMLRRKLWQVPYQVQLDDFRVERDPGTSRAAAFESDITRIEGEQKEEVLIEMNEPMREAGWTFFQASWGPQQSTEPDRYFSVFEVVKNPADQWPLWSLLVAMVGLFWQFGSRLFAFSSKPKKPQTT